MYDIKIVSTFAYAYTFIRIKKKTLGIKDIARLKNIYNLI